MEKRIILVSHGGLAAGMENTLGMLVGSTDGVSSYGLEPGASPEDIACAVEKEVCAAPEAQFFLVADIQGGSVSNAVTRLSMYPNVQIINGMNLPLVISLHFAPVPVEEADLDQILKEAREGIIIPVIRQVEDDDEDIL